MSFTVALGLSGLIEPLPLCALFRVLLIDRLPGKGFDDGEHPTVAEVAVVRNGKHAAAGLLLVRCHPFPQIPRVVATERSLRRKRYDLICLIGIIAEDYVAMQIVPASI